MREDLGEDLSEKLGEDLAISVKGLTKIFGARKVVDAFDMDVKKGAIYGFLGPNGSGKTTLLKAMTGEVSAEGETYLADRPISKMRPVELATRRAVLPQSGNIAFPFTVLELVRLGLTAGLSSVQNHQIEQLPLRALERVGLAGFEGRLVQELSGGERQRAQLARVLVQIWDPVLEGVPRWLFLDEPVSALDIGHQLVVMQIARDFAEAGGGVIVVMHDLNLTSMFADHVTLLDRGRVRHTGTPQEVLTDAHLSACYGCALRTNTPPPLGGPWLLPQAATSRSGNSA